MTAFTPCGECPLDRPCDEEAALRRALRGACTVTLEVDWQDPEPITADAIVRYCAAETHPGSWLEQPSYCENEASPGGDLCYEHDPDGAAADRAEQIFEERREREAGLHG